MADQERNKVDPAVAEEHGIRQWAETWLNWYLMPEAWNKPPTWILVRKLALTILHLLDRLEEQREHAAKLQ